MLKFLHNYKIKFINIYIYKKINKIQMNTIDLTWW